MQVDSYIVYFLLLKYVDSMLSIFIKIFICLVVIIVVLWLKVWNGNKLDQQS